MNAETVEKIIAAIEATGCAHVQRVSEAEIIIDGVIDVAHVFTALSAAPQAVVKRNVACRYPKCMSSAAGVCDGPCVLSALTTPPSQAEPHAVKMASATIRLAAEALRYLSTNDRPIGGEQHFNWAHLNQLADDLDPIPAMLAASPTPPADDMKAENERLTRIAYQLPWAEKCVRLEEEDERLRDRLNHYIKATTDKNSDLIAAETKVENIRAQLIRMVDIAEERLVKLTAAETREKTLREALGWYANRDSTVLKGGC